MSEVTDTERAGRPESRPRGPLLVRLGVEVVIGIALAAVLLLVAWASSNTISFVYGGY